MKGMGSRAQSALLPRSQVSPRRAVRSVSLHRALAAVGELVSEPGQMDGVPGHVALGQARRGDPLPADCCPYRDGTCVTESERASDSNHGLTTPNADSGADVF